MKEALFTEKEYIMNEIKEAYTCITEHANVCLQMKQSGSSVISIAISVTSESMQS